MKYLSIFICLILIACSAKNRETKESLLMQDPADTASLIHIDSTITRSESDTMKLHIQQFDVGTQFRLHEGDSTICEQNGLSIKVLKVRDNRCPPDVQCIRAGEIEVDLIIDYQSERITPTLMNPTRERQNGVQQIAMNNVIINFLGSTPENKSKIEVNKLQRDTTTDSLPLYFIVTKIK
jgi:hypothetical protein